MLRELENGLLDQAGRCRLTPLRREKRHGQSVIARTEGHAPWSVIRQFNLGHVDVDTEVSRRMRTLR